jgi:cytochrome P450
MDTLQPFKFYVPLQVYSLTALVAGLLLFTICTRSSPSLGHIPTIGPSGRLTSYLGAFRYLKDANKMVREGYHKYQRSPFKVATFSRWLVIVSTPQAVEELRHAADDDLSMMEAIKENFAADYTLVENILADPYHITVTKNQLTKNLGVLFPDLRDEIIQAFENEISPTAGWTKVPALKTMRRIVSQVSNRAFVGLPLCRDPDWISLNIEFTIDIMKAAAIIRLFPPFLKPIAGRLLTNVSAKVRRGLEHIVPVIESRQQDIEEYGKEWDGKPNDMLSWLMDEASKVESSTRNLTSRLMATNMAAIHTTSMSFTHALYSLAAMPQYLQPMREEVESVINKEGWTKAAMSKLYKVDSFLKESQRVNGLSALALTRKALRDFKFTDGTLIPKDTFVCVPTALHLDESNYANPEVFDGFRFVSKGMAGGDSGINQMIATNTSYIAFGIGRHSCPGRFFAANELKAMMAHLVLNYDIKLENEGVRPPDLWFINSRVPNPTAEILFRKRQL